jgi:hypothetical protein
MTRRSALSLLAAPAAPAAPAPPFRLYTTGYPKPFLYPLVAPDGAVLSRGWPVAPRPGDSEDHAWHRGLFWGHGDINGFDFWREQQGTASIRVDRQRGLTLYQSLLTPNGSRLARLLTRYRFTLTPGAWQIDAELSLTSPQPLRFGDTDDGGFAVRLREEFRLDRGAVMTNSTGLSGKAIWGQSADWTNYTTTLSGKPYGVALLSHPSNLRHPSGWHARPYGLNSANPFAASSFANEKGGQRGAYSLPAGQPLTLRYRVLLHQGVAIAERYTQFTQE